MHFAKLKMVYLIKEFSISKFRLKTKHFLLLVMQISCLIYAIEKVLLAILMSLILTALFCNKNN